MKVLLTMMAALMVTLLGGCASTKTTTEVVYETKTVYVKPDPTQLRAVTPKAPMDEASYRLLKDYEREVYLGDYSLHLFEKLGVCNAQLQSIQETVRKVTGGKP